jgi:hypothetical protein
MEFLLVCASLHNNNRNIVLRKHRSRLYCISNKNAVYMYCCTCTRALDLITYGTALQYTAILFSLKNCILLCAPCMSKVRIFKLLGSPRIDSNFQFRQAMYPGGPVRPYDNAIPTRLLAAIFCLKIPAQNLQYSMSAI